MHNSVNMDVYIFRYQAGIHLVIHGVGKHVVTTEGWQFGRVDSHLSMYSFHSPQSL